jgi:hypothetical protein
MRRGFAVHPDPTSPQVEHRQAQSRAKSHSTRKEEPGRGKRRVLCYGRRLALESHVKPRSAIRRFLSMDKLQAAHGRANMAVIGSPQRWKFAGMAGRRWNFGGLWR